MVIKTNNEEIEVRHKRSLKGYSREKPIYEKKKTRIHDIKVYII
jgi:hypothetical protein